MKTQHTPTLVVANFKLGYRNSDGSFTHIATLVTPTDPQADGEWDWVEGNGELIVRAVNSHEALLKHAKGRYSDISNTAEASRSDFEKRILKELEIVIAQAESL